MRGYVAGACAYGVWVLLTDPAKRQVEHWGPDWVVRVLQLGGAAVMNALGVSWAHVLDDARGVAAVQSGRAGGIGAVSPHGPYATCAIAFGMPFFRLDETRRGGIRVRSGGASALFWVPGLRELLLLYGVREATPAVIAKLVAAGCVVALNPGGLREQIRTDSAQEQVFANRRLGFLRLALEHRVPVVPMYGFGENQVYTAHPRRARALREALVRRFRVGLVVVSGRWGLSAGVLPLLPNPGTVVTHVVGRAVDVGGAARVPGAPVTEAELEEAYRRYKAELSRVFEKHKHALLPPEVAARGLLFHRL